MDSRGGRAAGVQARDGGGWDQEGIPKQKTSVSLTNQNPGYPKESL